MGNGRKDKDGECAQPLVAGCKDVESCENGETSDKGQAKKTCASNCLAFLRGAFGFLLFPFVFLLTLLAALVWIILLPGTPLRSTDLFLYFLARAWFFSVAF